METAAQAEIRTELDPVTFEVLKNACVNMSNQMGEVVVESCYPLFFARDFSSSVTDSNGDTVAQGTRILPRTSALTSRSRPT